ncbi:HK97-gp10 family putative phage morphogenesis protein [Ochrobactrum quorumnocens]|uniref:HK97 gp10 family phage protein n=1 Tax=Ochrobactrum quorumnocens TaxID=271865 RepID=A0A5N1K4M9_9HYPH|nr:HK97-gp10 family putative phage morphogenesis protein [[Ochrobactrum] quorumnocens]KAA9369561.1 HK97 gp10 family phage protein [[Ochrobactrum] quorumnocens]
MARTKVLGLESLRRKLKQIPQEAKAEIRRALEASADEIVKMAKNLAPVDDGDLQMSVSWTWGEAPKGSMILGRVAGPNDKNDLTITIYAGGGEAFYARWIEFGTEKMKAQPFFLPSYRANRKRARARITRGITKAAKKVAAGR